MNVSFNSSCSSSIWMVPKILTPPENRNGESLSTNRKLNELPVDDKYSLPKISDLLTQINKCQYLTTLDLAIEFLHIEILTRDNWWKLEILRIGPKLLIQKNPQ